MCSVLQDPVSHLLRQSANILSSGSSAAQHSSNSSSTACRNIPAGSSSVIPVTRDQAIQLEAQLEEALPPGAVLASQQQHIAVWQRQQQRHWKQQLSQQADILHHFQQQLADQQQEGLQLQGPGQVLPDCDVLAPQLTQQHQQMDGLLKEAAQQVHTSNA